MRAQGTPRPRGAWLAPLRRAWFAQCVPSLCPQDDPERVGDDGARFTGPVTPLTAEMIRRITVGPAIADAHRQLEKVIRLARDWSRSRGDHDASHRLTLAPMGQPRRRGRPPLSKEFLEQVAAAYKRGNPRAPAAAVRAWAKENEGRDVSKATVDLWIRRARERELLPPAARSRIRRGRKAR